MNGQDKVVALDEYRNNRDNKDTKEESLFDMDMNEINEAIQFTNHMPPLVVKEDLVADAIRKGDTKIISKIMAKEYLKDYIDLSSKDCSDSQIDMIARFIEGVYDMHNTTVIDGHIVYQKHKKEREIWIDGYNSLLQLL